MKTFEIMKEQEPKSRESGYYWVQIKKTRAWFIAEYESSRATWTQAFSIYEYLDSDFEEIDERKISRVSGETPKPDQPIKICYCGSLRVAKEAFQKAEYQSVLDGHIALLPCCMHVDIQREFGAESDYKQKADDLHKRKIDICDYVFVLNVGGYIGDSTRSEIEYAKKIGKPIHYLETYADQGETWKFGE